MVIKVVLLLFEKIQIYGNRKGLYGRESIMYKISKEEKQNFYIRRVVMHSSLCSVRELKEKKSRNQQTTRCHLQHRPLSREEALRTAVYVCDQNRNTQMATSHALWEGLQGWTVPLRQDKEWLIMSRSAGGGMASQVLRKLTAAFKAGKRSS